MSKFTLDKLKGKSPPRPVAALPTLRFHKSHEDLNIPLHLHEELKERVDSAVASPATQAAVTESTGTFSSDQPATGFTCDKPVLPAVEDDYREEGGRSSTPDPSDQDVWNKHVTLDRDVSPIKERLLLQFAKLAPDTASSSSAPEPEGSWLNQVKGKLSKTMDTSLEKYAELRAERLRSNRPLEQTNSLDLEFREEEEGVRSMSHSHSEMLLSLQDATKDTKDAGRPHSQIFDFDTSDWHLDLGEGKSDTPQSNTDSTGADVRAPPAPADTPTKSRKRFGIGSFLDRGNSGSPVRTEGVDTTPKRSLRSFMRSYVSKPQPEEKLSSSPGLEDCKAEEKPGPGLPETLTPSPCVEDPFSGTPEFVLVDTGEGTARLEEEEEDVQVDEDGVEALEVEELLLQPQPTLLYATDEGGEAPVRSPSPPPSTMHRVPLADLVNPAVICIIAVVNLTGLFPGWLSGFITGLMICTILTIWCLLKLYPAVSYSSARKQGTPTHITVHEPPLPVQTWMNLLPVKFHPYDVDRYEVKNTISVRITVEHHMLKIEYPDKNIPKRLNTDEVVPGDLKFHLHTDHVDLTTARISLLPAGIAGKRMFSKKYPIEIRPNAVPPPDTIIKDPAASPSAETAAQTEDTADAEDKHAAGGEDTEFKSVDSRRTSLEPDTELDVDEIEEEVLTSTGGAPPLEQDQKVFYLFARADREKEDVYKALMNGHYFLADTLLDVNRKGPEPDQENSRETAREIKASYNEFMARIMDAAHSPSALPASPATATTPEQTDWCIHFFNVYLHRIFYDIHKSVEIKTLLKTRIYNKLLKIKITQWFKQIDVTEINMGSNLPKIKWVSRPTENERGLWVSLGIEYGGIASATIETCGFNLGEEQLEAGGSVQLKALLEENPEALPIRPNSPAGERKISSRIQAATNSDEEDSAESDSEESGEINNTNINPESPVQRTRWWEMVGNSELVKTGIHRLSNSEWWKAKTSKKMTLQLEVVSLKGVIVLNIPPPPSDRIWYGFKTKPELDLRILPYYGEIKLGEDNSLFSTAVNKGIHVLVNRLKEEIHKFILLPNMDDIPIKIMSAFPTTNSSDSSNPYYNTSS